MILPGLEEAAFGDDDAFEEPFVGHVVRDRARRQWVIECEPHVMRVLKRMFERIPKETPTGRAPLADSPANCKTLLWFMAGQRLQVSDEDMAYLQAQSVMETKRQRSVSRVLTGKYTPTKFKVGIEPWPFQPLPAELTLVAGGHLCADEVGVGKTLEGALLLSDPRALPALVVMPAQLVRQWVRKLAQYLPGARVHVLSKRTPYTLPDPFPDILICTYAKLAGWAATLAPVLNAVIYDEVHNLCHEWGPPPQHGEERKRLAKYEAALHLRDHVRYRLGLSGTPIKNYGGEVRVVMNVLLPDALGTPKEFAREWTGGALGEKAVVKDPHALGAQMVAQGLMTNRTRKEVGRYLPPLSIQIQPVEVDMSRLNQVKIETIEYAKLLLRRSGDPEAKRDAARNIDWKLRHATGLAKAPAVIEFVKIVAARTPVLLLGWHIDFWKEMAKGLAEFKPVFFTGQQTEAQKDRSVQAFLSGASQVMGLSHRAAEGLDSLQDVCSTIIIGELDWSYSQMMKQNVGRLQREGQKENVFVHVMVADDGADPYMEKALGIKREQIEGLLHPDAPKIEVVQTDPKHAKELARSWLAAHDPRALKAIEREIAEAEASQAAEKEDRRAKRKGGRGLGGTVLQIAPAPTAPPPARPPLDMAAAVEALAARALRPDDDVLGTILTVASGAAAVGVTSGALEVALATMPPVPPPPPVDLWLARAQRHARS